MLEFIGGILTGSVAIASDAVHDLGDAATIGLSYLLEKKSTRQPDETHTYGYARYSVIGSAVTNLILLFGSVLVTANAVPRLINPVKVNYDGMLLFALIGVFVNFGAALLTRGGKSLNQKAVNLHMLEDVLGWVAVLIGAIIIRYTGFDIIDPILSVIIALFVFLSSARNLCESVDLFVEKTPRGIDVKEIIRDLSSVDGVLDVHHVHVWSMDGQCGCATMHIRTNAEPCQIKVAVRSELALHGIRHVTIELEAEDEVCCAPQCVAEHKHDHGHHHHHHH